MKITALQDNLSKVKAVEEMTQQLLRFPGEMQEMVANQLRKRRRARQRKINRSKESNGGKLNPKNEFSQVGENAARGRKENPANEPEEYGRQCSIDLKV